MRIPSQVVWAIIQAIPVVVACLQSRRTGTNERLKNQGTPKATTITAIGTLDRIASSTIFLAWQRLQLVPAIRHDLPTRPGITRALGIPATPDRPINPSTVARMIGDQVKFGCPEGRISIALPGHFSTSLSVAGQLSGSVPYASKNATTALPLSDSQHPVTLLPCQIRLAASRK